MKKPIAIGLSPNTKKEDVLLSLKLFLMPWSYNRGESVKTIERWFRTYFSCSYAVSFNSARSALYAILHALDLEPGDEVILQAFTCVVVPNAVIAAGAKPVYVDIDESYTIDPGGLQKKITKKTKAIIVQHTFGISSDMEKIMDIAKKNKLFVIEDCACTIGGEYKGKKLGTFGHAGVFSFGRDKAYSSVFGGIAIIRQEKFGKKLRLYQKQKSFPSFIFVMQQLWYPVLSSLVLSTYYFLYFGKTLHFILRKMQFFSFPLLQSEKKGVFNPRNVKRYPNALASLALLQLKNLPTSNARRVDIGKQYQDMQGEKIRNGSIPWLRFPVMVNDKQKAIRYFAERGIFIGDWYSQPIDPKSVTMEKVQYVKGFCANAESFVKHVINLPTFPKMTDEEVTYVCEAFKAFKKTDTKS